jgi:hypothetical protein
MVVNMKMFPIMIPYDQRKMIADARQLGSVFIVIAIPWDMIVSHEKQAVRNHSQTLERLAERGGLSAEEALSAINDRGLSWERSDWAKANAELASLVIAFLEITKC